MIRQEVKMNQERTKILEMLKEGKISVEEAEKLLSAVEEQEEPGSANGSVKPKSRLHIQVFEGDLEKAKVNIRLPLKLVKWGMRFIPKDASNMTINDRQISYDELIDILNNAESGELVEVFDNEKNTKVVIRAN
jgi:DNA-directed RNA polymerase subunit F